jgi:3-methyladenine DNA glycosylase AlkC
MAELLKHRYSRQYIETLAVALKRASPSFDAAAFTRTVLGRGWNGLELKQRMRRIAQALHAHVPGNYRQQLRVLRAAAPGFGGFEGMFFPDFVELYGRDDFDASVDALAEFTRYSSSEFAVRPFIVRYGERMLAAMTRWAVSDNEHLRRLASEGCRPRLPWAMTLPEFKRDPAPVLAILERLKNDPSEYVRRSVANNLNDIAKDHPQLVLGIARRWLGTSAATDALVKHACRTLLKRGDAQALALFGHHDGVEVGVRGFKLAAPRIPIGTDLAFGFEVVSRTKQAARLRVEYAVDFVKSAGHTTRKVFKVAELQLDAGAAARFERRHRFRDFTTRKHYPGKHRIAIVVNGVQRAARLVELVPAHAAQSRRKN